MKKTVSEQLFEDFCIQQNLNWQRISENHEKTPDYYIHLKDSKVAVEIKQLESMRGFNPAGVSSRNVGTHVRHQISQAKSQLQIAARSGIPTILLIHNTTDPLQMFGTESHDFLCAMYGDLTIKIDTHSLKKSEAFHGRNALMRHDINTSFSAVGHLKKTKTGAKVIIYENIFAARPLPFDEFPASIEVVRIELENFIE